MHSTNVVRLPLYMFNVHGSKYECKITRDIQHKQQRIGQIMARSRLSGHLLACLAPFTQCIARTSLMFHCLNMHCTQWHKSILYAYQIYVYLIDLYAILYHSQFVEYCKPCRLYCILRNVDAESVCMSGGCGNCSHTIPQRWYWTYRMCLNMHSNWCK